METGPALLLSTIIVIVLVIGAAYGWYNFTGWTSFTYQTGDSPAWVPDKQADLSRLRFKDCVFTVARGDGATRSINAAPVLNSMATAFKGGEANPLTLTLTRPLNPFSFVIDGFNDRETVPDPTAAPWCSSPPAVCTADSDCPHSSVAGACGPLVAAKRVCVNCAGGADVTLTGFVRTI